MRKVVKEREMPSKGCNFLFANDIFQLILSFNIGYAFQGVFFLSYLLFI